MASKPIQHMRQPSTGAGSRIYSRENVGRYSERARQRKRGKRVRRGVIATLVILLLVGGSALALTIAKSIINGSLQGASGYLSGLSGILTDANTAKDPFNILLLGTDGRPGEDTYRSDSIILAHVDPVKKTASLISIPRDTKVVYKGTTMKINETHSYGGPEAVVTSVKELCGVDIAYYAEVSFTGMKSLVDAVGGIDLYIPEGDAVDDPDAGPVTVEAGQQHLDGEAALTFSRARHQFADGDYTRMRHQRMVLGALAQKILNHMDITQIPTLLSSLSDMLITTMDVDDIVGVITAMKGMDTANIWSANLPSYSDDTTYIDGKSYVFVYEDALQEMMERMEAGENPGGPNSSGKEGTGATLGDLANNTSDDWANGDATTSSESEASSGSSSSSSSSS
ncbi:MAG: LCP family protein [Collinsella sp.]|nr:LCP family protein [Collinsella sp.]